MYAFTVPFVFLTKPYLIPDVSSIIHKLTISIIFLLLILKYIKKRSNSKVKNINVGVRFRFAENLLISPFEWMSYLKASKFVVTNSFHCVVFSLIFHKKFDLIIL